MNQNLFLIIPFSPLIASFITGIYKNKFNKNAHLITILGISISMFCSLITFIQLLHGNIGYNFTIYEWMHIGNLKFEIGFLIDSLTITMMCLITIISLIVNVYSIGYMANDNSYQRFFCYISLFTFSMLILVMSNNFLQLFFGWELVGFISYLLIGFWFTKSNAIYANMKAFLVNRVSDFGFILGIALIVKYTGSLNYTEVFKHNIALSNSNLHFFNTSCEAITVICICLFIGAMGKSAQFPFHVWLPDSMEGPTPVSALIHAATMVTAGIFILARMSPLFELSDKVLSLITIIGSISILLMGMIALVQTDIKRIIAYSTLSQLGYMTVAVGVSAYSAAIFHLMTHAFFKALLFLSAGSVMISMQHNQDIRNMGNLRKYIPITWITSLIGYLALSGIPFFSGFYSKHSIIEYIKESHLFGANFAYYCAILGVFITSLYSFRVYFLVFHGNNNFLLKKTDPFELEQYSNISELDQITKIKNNITYTYKKNNNQNIYDKIIPHESSILITIPLLLLSIPSLFIGAIAIKPMLYNNYFKYGIAFKNVLFVQNNHINTIKFQNNYRNWLDISLTSLSTITVWLTMFGIILAYFLYIKKPNFLIKIRIFFKKIYQILINKYYIDFFYEKILISNLIKFSYFLWIKIDQMIIDNIVNGSSNIIVKFSNLLSYLQTGRIYHYLFLMITSIVVLLLIFINFIGI